MITFSDFISAMVSYIANWDDGSFMISPVMNFDLMQNLSLAAGVYLPLGEETGEFRSKRPDVFFIWLKINF